MFHNHFTIKTLAAAIALVVGGIFGSAAQAQTHTIHADFGSPRVAGPNSLFSMVLTMDPADVNISGFSIQVAYDNTQVTLLSATDNTGQVMSAPLYELGNEMPLSGVPNVNAFKPLTMDTAMDLYNPTNLVQLNFQATSAFSDPNNRVWLHLDGWGVDGGLIDGMDVDGDPKPIPTEYLDAESEEVPVSLSGFTLE